MRSRADRERRDAFRNLGGQTVVLDSLWFEQDERTLKASCLRAERLWYALSA